MTRDHPFTIRGTLHIAPLLPTPARLGQARVRLGQTDLQLHATGSREDRYRLSALNKLRKV